MGTEYTAGIWIDTNIDNSVGDQAIQLLECCRGSGSIGCFAKDKSGAPVLLSCSHVLFPNDLATSTASVFQPRFSSCCSGDKIAAQVVDSTQLKDGKYAGGYNEIHLGVKVIYNGVITDPGGVPNGFYPTETDCAAACLGKGIKFRNVWRYTVNGQPREIPLVGAVNDPSSLGVTKGPPLGQRPSLDQYVSIYSERLGRMVYGTVMSMPGSPVGPPPSGDPDRLLTPNGYGDPTKMRPACHQLLILPRPDPNPSSNKPYAADYDAFRSYGIDHGDSGTVVINSKKQIIGMVCMGVKPSEVFDAATVAANVELSSVSVIAVVTPIRNILELLQVTIPDDPNGWSGTTPSEGARIFVPGRRDDDDESARQLGLARMREGLRKSRRGRLLLGKIGQHGRELRFMYNRVRELAATWQHLRGPAFMHQGLQSLERPGHAVPHVISGTSRRALVDAILPVIEAHASPRLRRDLTRYRPWVEATLLDLDAVDDVIDAMSRPWATP